MAYWYNHLNLNSTGDLQSGFYIGNSYITTKAPDLHLDAAGVLFSQTCLLDQHSW